MENKERIILRDTIISDAKRLMEIHPEYRYGQSVFNIVDQCIGLARTVQFCDGIDCFYDDEKVDAFIEKVIDRMEKHEDNEKMRRKIKEMFFLYNKENQVEDNKRGQLSSRRLTLEEILKNRKEAIKTLMDMPKSELVDYILGINNKIFLELEKI